MPRLPSFQFYPADWLADKNLRRCGAVARGCWIDLLCIMHQTEERGVLIENGVPWTREEAVESIGGGDAKFGFDILTKKGVLKQRDDGAYYSSRMVRDEEIRQNHAKAGKNGGRPLKTHKLGKERQNQIKSKVKSISKPPPVDVDVDVDVDVFSSTGGAGGAAPDAIEIYAAYPKHVGRPTALKAIDAALKKIPAADLLAKTKAYAASIAGWKEKRFIPNPATWFNQERWNDDLEQSPSVGGVPHVTPNVPTQREQDAFLREQREQEAKVRAEREARRAAKAC